MKDALPWVTVVTFFLVGLWCLLGARRMQQQSIEASKDLKVNPFRNYVNSPAYVVVTRIIGVIALVIAIVVLFFTVYDS